MLTLIPVFPHFPHKTKFLVPDLSHDKQNKVTLFLGLYTQLSYLLIDYVNKSHLETLKHQRVRLLNAETFKGEIYVWLVM